MKVIFSHGKESGPWGSKIKALASLCEAKGFEVDSIDYSGILDPDERAEKLINILKNEHDELILVGSSMGGYVSLVASQHIALKGLFLMAPALFIEGYKNQEYFPKTKNISVVHGWSDDIIPVDNSIRFSKDVTCSLHLIDGDHRLNSSLTALTNLFDLFLETCKA